MSIILKIKESIQNFRSSDCYLLIKLLIVISFFIAFFVTIIVGLMIIYNKNNQSYYTLKNSSEKIGEFNSKKKCIYNVLYSDYQNQGLVKLVNSNDKPILCNSIINKNSTSKNYYKCIYGVQYYLGYTLTKLVDQNDKPITCQN